MAKIYPCVCQMDPQTGIRGVLLNGERCDTCERFPDDETAQLFLSVVRNLERVTVYIESAGLIPPCVREARKIIAQAKGGE